MKTIKDIFNRIFHQDIANVDSPYGVKNSMPSDEESNETVITKEFILNKCKDSIHEICILCLEPFI
ncbi:MAG: hypothetical protein KBT06_07150 [Prevotellaceae bacterium]|nr:hypothetical protein [Candidatus Colivivens equi]